MSTHLRIGDFSLDFDELYARMWDIATDDHQDGTRLFRPRPGQHEAIKWLVADLAGTPVDDRRTMPANSALRRAVHEQLLEGGLAERISQSSFRLLRSPLPGQEDGLADGSTAVDADDSGQAVDDVSIDVIGGGTGLLTLAGQTWSAWTSLERAAVAATTKPGVYVARIGDELVYVGMAGERRGQGVRGRLRVYARGRGAVSGLGEAALDRALADLDWVQDRLIELRDHGPSRAKEWAVAALTRRHLEVAWAGVSTASDARALEHDILLELEDVQLWNRHRPPRRSTS